MNRGRYTDKVIDEAVALVKKGTDPKDVADILRGRYDYEKLHPKTVARWARKYPFGKVRSSLSKHTQEQIGEVARLEVKRWEAERERQLRMEEHRQALLTCLEDLRGVEAFPLHNYDLALWHSRPADPCWPMAKGFICRDTPGRLTVHTDVEKRQEWTLLRQHLPDAPLWGTLRVWKQAVARDMATRMALLKEVTRSIERPASRGGLGLPVIPEIGLGGTPKPAVSMFYAFSIYDRTLSLALGVRSAPHGSESFTWSGPKVIDLEGRPAISAEDHAQIERAKNFLYRAETGWVGHPETRAAAETYRRAEERTQALKPELERVQAMEAFPSGSLCDGCKALTIGAGRDTPAGN